MKRTILSATLLFIMAIMAQAQNITVHGKVLSKSGGEPLIGASVLCESTQTGASTDIDGNFTISVPEGATLKFSYIGFNPTEAKATPEMTIHLGENSEVLDDVVVVGYQIVRKADLTGAVSVMDMKEPLSENSGNIMSSMAGRLPGVNVVPDAAPGGTGTIRVRGMSTANSSNDPPLHHRRCAYRQHQLHQPERHRVHAGAEGCCIGLDLRFACRQRRGSHHHQAGQGRPHDGQRKLLDQHPDDCQPLRNARCQPMGA